jgi:hypothetical protein
MLKGKKTYVVAALAVLSAIGAYLTGDATLAQAIQLAVTALLGMTLRSGITTESEMKF